MTTSQPPLVAVRMVSGQGRGQPLARKTLADHIHPCRGISMSIFSIIMYVLDVGSDIWLATKYFVNGDMAWGGWTITFVLLAQVLLFFMGLCMAKGWRKLITPVLPVIIEMKNIGKYMEIKRYKPSADDLVYRKVLENEHGKVFLKMVEVVFESLPQLILQFYIMCAFQQHEHDYLVLQIVSIVTALMSICFTTVALHRIDILQRAEYDNPELSIAHDALHVISSCLIIASRVACFILFTIFFKFYVLIVILLHFAVYFLWLLCNIGVEDYAGTAMVSLLASVSALFTPDIFLTYEDNESIRMPGSQACRFWTYNMLHLVEDAILITCWYLFHGTHESLGETILILVVVAMVVGFLLDVITRGCFTPRFLCGRSSSDEDEIVTSNEHDEPMIDNAV